LMNTFTEEDKITDEIATNRYNSETDRLGKYLTQWLKGTSMGGITAAFDATTDDPVEWWGDLLVEYGPLATLAMFLLDAPVQSATCEQIFKNYAAFHTKKRNQLGNQKVYQMTQVKYNMSAKYGSTMQSEKREKVSQQKNKAVSPEEHKKIGAEEMISGTMDDEVVEVEELERISEEDVPPIEVSEWIELFDEMDDDDEKELEEEETPMQNKGLPKDDTDPALNYFSIDDHSDRVMDRETGEKLEWPDWTDYDGHDTFANWPQDNKKFQQQMKRKYGISYVRTDRYSLERLCKPWKDTDEEMPSMEGSYGQDYG
jgi:hypothetical protein